MEPKIAWAPYFLISGFFGVGILLLPFGFWKYLFFWIGGISLLLSVISLVICLREIPAAPPHVGLVTIWRRKMPIIKKEGKVLLAPFPPFWYEVIYVNVEKKDKDFKPEDVMSADNVEMLMEISITWTPDYEIGDNLINYINTGGKEKVEDILDDALEEKCRTFAMTKEWKVLRGSGTEVSRELIGELAGVNISQIEIDKVRKGNGIVRIPSLGIILNRLYVGTVRTKGELEKKAEKAAVETQERDAEKIELEHVRDRIREFKNLGLSSRDALEVVQTERGKVSKEIQEFKGLESFTQTLGYGVAKLFQPKKGDVAKKEKK